MFVDYIKDYMFLSYPFKFYIDMFVYKYIKFERKQAWDVYLVQYNNMTRETFRKFDFDERIKSSKNKNKKTISKDEIVKNAESFINRISNGKKEGE